MDTCWFNLKQAHYLAPEYVHESMAFGEAEGDLLLGHFLPGPRAIDNVINQGGVAPFPKNMRIRSQTVAHFRYVRNSERTIEGGAGGGGPVGPGVPVEVTVDAGTMFRRHMGESWTIERLESQIVQPTPAYFALCRRSAELAAWIAKHKTLGAWTVYMITGLMIARGAKTEKTDGSEQDVHGEGGVDAAGVIKAKFNSKYKAKDEGQMSGEFVNDFVWAIRLTRVWKGVFDSEEQNAPFTKGSVFGPSSGKIDVDSFLAEEGLARDDVEALEVTMEGEDSPHLFLTIDGNKSTPVQDLAAAKTAGGQ